MPAKMLYLLRHAHTEKGDAITPDHERALSAGGLEECEAIGNWLKNAHPAIDFVLSSDARRTQETYRQIRRFHPLPPAQWTSALYLAPAGKIMNLVNALPETAHAALIIAHNPGLFEFAERALLEEERSERLLEGFSTCGLFALETPVTQWDLIRFGIGRFRHYITPAAARLIPPAPASR